MRRDMNCIRFGAEPFCRFNGVVVSPEMDEKRARPVIEHVIVDGRDLDARSRCYLLAADGAVQPL
jgi:hypothetical protein